MEFKPLYFADKLQIINPHGNIGVVTLWSKVDYVIERFRQAGVDLNPATSPIAVFGNLYGNGLREMLRNLLYNPQIHTLLICGNDRSGSRKELESFFGNGLEPIEEANISYLVEAGNVQHPWRIKGTRRLIDGLVQPKLFPKKPRIEWMGDPTKEIIIGKQDDSIINTQIRVFFANFENLERRPLEQSADNLVRPDAVPPLPQVETSYFPSNPRSHLVVRDTILEAWKEVLYLLTRFGRRVTLKKGERLELQHVKVVVEKPHFETNDELNAVNLDPGRLGQYSMDFFDGEMRPDETYNYGHRLRSYFKDKDERKIDTLTACAARLKEDDEDRKSYISLWDTGRDLKAKEGRPCLVSLYFRKFEGKLTLSATFRTHNAMDAYPMNLYGLMAIQGWVAKEAGLAPGALVVISHSLGLDPKELDRAMLIIGQRPFKVRLDPMGYFRITLDGKDILVEHRFEDVTLKEYRGKKAARLQHEIARDVALSDINHAIYLGRQLARAEIALKEGREFIQE